MLFVESFPSLLSITHRDRWTNCFFSFWIIGWDDDDDDDDDDEGFRRRRWRRIERSLEMVIA